MNPRQRLYDVIGRTGVIRVRPQRDEGETGRNLAAGLLMMLALWLLYGGVIYWGERIAGWLR